MLLLLQGHLGVERHGPLGTLWASIGLICFYIALIWINSLLGLFLTPLFMIPQTWLMDRVLRRRRARRAAAEGAPPEGDAAAHDAERTSAPQHR